MQITDAVTKLSQGGLKLACKLQKYANEHVLQLSNRQIKELDRLRSISEPI